MRRLVLSALCLALAGPASADVSVSFKPVRDVSSFEYRSASERDALFRSMAELLKKLGRQLPPGRTLDVELLEIRPAGRIDPWIPSDGSVRIVSDVTPPQVKLRYAVKDRGRRIAGGVEDVTDLNYLSDISARTSLASFPYETELMRDWFRDRIVRMKPPLR